MPTIYITLTVKDQTVSASTDTTLVADSRNLLRMRLEHRDQLWDGLTKTAVFTAPDGTAYNMLVGEDDTCAVPAEVVKAPGFHVSIFGGDLVTANKAHVPVEESGLADGVSPPEPTPDIYDQLVATVAEQRAASEMAANDAAEDAGQTAADRATVEALAGQVATDAGQVASDKLIVITQRQLAEIAAAASQAARDQAQQAMTDLLAMMGTDIATLTGGKLTPSQIPAISLIKTVPVADRATMLALDDVQPGDCAQVLTDDDGYTHLYQLGEGGDPAEYDDWLSLQTPNSFVANAGHTATADTAENADRINGKRMVSMTQSQYDNAALDADTYYIVTPD